MNIFRFMNSQKKTLTAEKKREVLSRLRIKLQELVYEKVINNK